jgi:hypothetical protein
MTAAKRGEPGRPAARSRMTGAMPDGADRTRGRTATLNQLLLAAVVFVLGVLVAVGPFGGEPVLFFLGVVLVIAVTAVTLVVPWNSLPYGWVAIVPAIDIVAITLMQIADLLRPLSK